VYSFVSKRSGTHQTFTNILNILCLYLLLETPETPPLPISQSRDEGHKNLPSEIPDINTRKCT